VKTFLRWNRVSRSTLRKVEALTSSTALRLREADTRARRRLEIIGEILRGRFPHHFQ
jgi:hypothetical protein